MLKVFYKLLRWLRSLFVHEPVGAEPNLPADWLAIRRSPPPQHWRDLAQQSGPIVRISAGQPPDVRLPRREMTPITKKDGGKRELVRTSATVPTIDHATQRRGTAFPAEVSVESAIAQKAKVVRFPGFWKRVAAAVFMRKSSTVKKAANQLSFPGAKSERTPAGATYPPVELHAERGKRVNFSPEQEMPRPTTSFANRTIETSEKAAGARPRFAEPVTRQSRKTVYAVGLSSPLNFEPSGFGERDRQVRQEAGVKVAKVPLPFPRATKMAEKKNEIEISLATPNLWPELAPESELSEISQRAALRAAQRAERLEREQRGY